MRSSETADSERSLVVWFDSGEASSTDRLGGKCAGLAEMTTAGLPVPTGFGVTTTAHQQFMSEPTLARQLHHARAAAQDATFSTDLAQAEAQLQEAASATALPDALVTEITSAYAELARRVAVPDPPVAVRSSGQSEDGAAASFAGQYDTYLWVVGTDAVLDHVRRVWVGSLAMSTQSYRTDRALGLEFSLMCVGVQRMVEARTAGVMFTLDPLNGDRSRMVIEASWGLGEAVVRGDVNPDRFAVNKVTGLLSASEIGDKAHEYRFDPASGAVAPIPIEGSRRLEASLSPEEIARLVELGKRIERLRGAPQDIEWAIDETGVLSVLQVRPETVWSRRSAGDQTEPSNSGGALDCVISTFIAGGR
jgi:pyruvate,water dikinase